MYLCDLFSWPEVVRELQRENKTGFSKFYHIMHKYETMIANPGYFIAFIDGDRTGWMGPYQKDDLNRMIEWKVSKDAIIDIYPVKCAEERFEIRI
jgi:hypothetical protein